MSWIDDYRPTYEARQAITKRSPIRSQATVAPENHDQHSRSDMKILIDEWIRQGITLDRARGLFEREFIAASLRRNGGNASRAAKSLGIHRNTLRQRITGTP